MYYMASRYSHKKNFRSQFLDLWTRIRKITYQKNGSNVENFLIEQFWRATTKIILKCSTTVILGFIENIIYTFMLKFTKI